MGLLGHQVPVRQSSARRLRRLVASAVVLAASTVAGLLALPAVPAYADVTSGFYTIGTPSPAVTGVTVAPSGATTDAVVNFQVSFDVGPSLAGTSHDWVSVAPSTPLGSTPANIALLGGSCVQAGTNGGAYSATGITVDLASACSVASGTKAEVDFQVRAPVSSGTFTFAVTTSRNSTPGTSNIVTVSTSGSVLTAVSYVPGTNTVYTVTGSPVVSLTSASTSLTLTAGPTHGPGTITFVNSGTGGAGYSVSVRSSGGSATTDTVTNASATGATVTLALSTALVNGDTLSVTASGQNPAPSGSAEANDVSVQPGNGTVETTNSIAFGKSVSAVAVAVSTPVATAQATYTVGFTATDAVSVGGYIYLTETAGPTNFSTVTGIEVVDNTQGWHFIASGSVLTDGTATVPLQDAVTAGDNLSMVLGGVTNPPAAGTVSDFTVATSGDPVAADAPTYMLVANASPGVVVGVSPNTTGTIATYTISNIHATGTLTAGASTIKLQAPAGTVFANNPAYYSITDGTNPSGSGTVANPVSGGGTNVVTFTVPDTISTGDAFTVVVADVLNPGVASGTDLITLVGSVTGPTPVAATTTTTSTTTPPPTTTTTRPPVKKKVVPKIADLTASADVSKKDVVDLKFYCSSKACKGTVTLTDVATVVGNETYGARAGKTVTVTVHVTPGGVKLLAGAKHHTIRVTVKVTVSGGKTVKEKTTLVA